MIASERNEKARELAQVALINRGNFAVVVEAIEKALEQAHDEAYDDGYDQARWDFEEV